MWHWICLVSGLQKKLSSCILVYKIQDLQPLVVGLAWRIWVKKREGMYGEFKTLSWLVTHTYEAVLTNCILAFIWSHLCKYYNPDHRIFWWIFALLNKCFPNDLREAFFSPQCKPKCVYDFFAFHRHTY